MRPGSTDLRSNWINDVHGGLSGAFAIIEANHGNLAFTATRSLTSPEAAPSSPATARPTTCGPWHSCSQVASAASKKILGARRTHCAASRRLGSRRAAGAGLGRRPGHPVILAQTSVPVGRQRRRQQARRLPRPPPDLSAHTPAPVARRQPLVRALHVTLKDAVCSRAIQASKPWIDVLGDHSTRIPIVFR
jgi:hypothetical protein